jgi:hypothetical protein
MSRSQPSSPDYRTPAPAAPPAPAVAPAPAGSGDLADVLERVLDRGVVIAGDIRVNLLDIELLTIKIRLLVASVDKAQEMGIDWWRNDPMLNARAQDLEQENLALRQRLQELEPGSSDGDSSRSRGRSSG